MPRLACGCKAASRVGVVVSCRQWILSPPRCHSCRCSLWGRSWCTCRCQKSESLATDNSPETAHDTEQSSSEPRKPISSQARPGSCCNLDLPAIIALSSEGSVFRSVLSRFVAALEGNHQNRCLPLQINLATLSQSLLSPTAFTFPITTNPPPNPKQHLLILLNRPSRSPQPPLPRQQHRIPLIFAHHGQRRV